MAGKQNRQSRKPQSSTSRRPRRRTNNVQHNNMQSRVHPNKPAQPSYVFAAPDDLRMKLSVTHSREILRLITDLYNHGGGNLTFENGYISYQAAVAPYGNLHRALQKLSGPS
ncbi:N protein [Free State vervet virus]|uniref:N protein n=1 Tax=Free State vervet virus TaxID=1737586 RepID=A0A159D7E1_9NIDO|nr:N protein [Free State vervet virus]ALS54305.1 N protein [Free State vervet virus]